MNRRNLLLRLGGAAAALPFLDALSRTARAASLTARGKTAKFIVFFHTPISFDVVTCRVMTITKGGRDDVKGGIV